MRAVIAVYGKDTVLHRAVIIITEIEITVVIEMSADRHIAEAVEIGASGIRGTVIQVAGRLHVTETKDVILIRQLAGCLDFTVNEKRVIIRNINRCQITVRRCDADVFSDGQITGEVNITVGTDVTGSVNGLGGNLIHTSDTRAGKVARTLNFIADRDAVRSVQRVGNLQNTAAAERAAAGNRGCLQIAYRRADGTAAIRNRSGINGAVRLDNTVFLIVNIRGLERTAAAEDNAGLIVIQCTAGVADGIDIEACGRTG